MCLSRCRSSQMGHGDWCCYLSVGEPTEGHNEMNCLTDGHIKMDFEVVCHQLIIGVHEAGSGYIILAHKYNSNRGGGGLTRTFV